MCLRPCRHSAGPSESRNERAARCTLQGICAQCLLSRECSSCTPALFVVLIQQTLAGAPVPLQVPFGARFPILQPNSPPMLSPMGSGISSDGTGVHFALDAFSPFALHSPRFTRLVVRCVGTLTVAMSMFAHMSAHMSTHTCPHTCLHRCPYTRPHTHPHAHFDSLGIEQQLACRTLVTCRYNCYTQSTFRQWPVIGGHRSIHR